MSAPILPGAQAGPSSLPSASASQRARQIQHALKSIVLETASTLRSRSQLARLQSAGLTSSASTAAESVNESSSSMDQLTGECARYLSLVHGLRDYLLHAQAALEIELEAATQREAKEAQIAALAAAEALKMQQQAEEAAKKKAEEEAERKRLEAEEQAASADTKNGTMKDGEGKKEDDSLAGLATPPLLTITTDQKEAQSASSADAKKPDAGTAAGDAIVIDSDGDDEDDVPLAFAPKAGAADGKTIDLTDSPTLANLPKPQPSDIPANPMLTLPDSTTASTTTATGTAAPAGIPGLDLSAFGIDMSSLGNMSDLSSLGIPSLANTTTTNTTSTADASSLPPATDFSELEKMMGIDLSSTSTSADPASSSALPNLSSLGSFGLGGGDGGFGDENDMFGSGSGGLDLSNFDFSSLNAGGDAGMGAGAGVDLSSFLTNFASGTGDEASKEGGGS
ncbi:hypothetical protein PHSY_000216 [Pseudozyma hubeiensis SY62]|uniref:Uncharacterized protein n=1 Tax=Pseudozyma hubeiensis (strain SY62) TaxID=1305764 RepID=R9NW39_PSEHS|nr:hypothetical protein PHSY_000216 [Pseudozyma hubeiensis SY62]GAC92662.1 hypothetical protein PHSY_000216 [Pseudozyma hubeiensis SY62]